MKLHLILLGQVVVFLTISAAKALDRRLFLEYHEFELQRRTATGTANSAKSRVESQQSFRNSADGRGAPQTSDSSRHRPSRSQSRPPSGSPSSDSASRGTDRRLSLKRNRSPSPTSPQAGRSTPSRDNSNSSGPSRSRSSSVSHGSWKGFGFTSSSSPSSWGSERYRSDVNPVVAMATAKGPAVIRSRASADKFRTYKDIKKDQEDQVYIEDRNKVQMAVYARRGGKGMVSGFHVLDLGESSKIVVDARKSKHGGWVEFTDENGQVGRETVSPGTRDSRSGGYEVKGFIHGPGKVKVTTKNEGWEDLGSMNSGHSS